MRAFKLYRRAALCLAGLGGGGRAQERVRRVPLRAILSRNLLDELLDDLKKPVEEFDRNQKTLYAGLREAAKVARFNFHAAGALLEAEGEPDEETLEEARRLAVEGIDRTAGRIEKLLPETGRAGEALRKAAGEEFERVWAHIRRDCDVADTLGERVAAAWEAALRSWRLLEERSQRKLSSTRSSTGLLRVRAGQWLDSIRSNLGLRAVKVEASQSALEEASVEFALKDAPALYRRLFRFEPLSDEDFLTGREEQLQACRVLRQRLDAGLSAAVAVTGPVGIGKTSFANCLLLRHFPDSRVVRARVESHVTTGAELVKYVAGLFEWTGETPRSLDSLVAGLRALPEKPVVFLEGGSRLHLRRVGGLDAVRALFSLLSGTEGRVAWIITFSQTGWDYLNGIFGLARRFDVHAALDGLDRSELEAALMARHEVSGYELEFVEGPGLSADVRWKLRKAKTSEERRNLLREEYFDVLHAAAGRNLHAALYYWLRSTQSLGRRKVRAAPPAPFRKGVLGELTLNELFSVLYALEHDHLTPPIHGELLRSTPTESRTLLDYLARRRILNVERKDGEEPRYRPNPILLEPVKDVLRDRNFIHA